MMRTPFSAVGFYTPACIACDSLSLSPCAEQLRKLLARGLVGSCVGKAEYKSNRNGLTIYLCARHAQQKIAKAK